MNRLKLVFVVLVFVVVLNDAHAGTIGGAVQLASSGKGVANGVFTFTLTQPAVASGTAVVVTSPVNCYTDGSGNVVGLPNPLTAASLSSNAGGGTLPAGNYFVRYTWANASGETVAGPEVSRTTTATGVLVVQVPVNPPASATQWKIYISTAAGTETLQSTQAAPFSNYSQSAPLVSGAALPGSNTSVCSLRFNDELQPSYTGYTVNLTTASGAIVPGFPQKWYLNGGAGGTINLGSGLPLYSGMVVYPQPIISNPANNGMQSINGPLNLNGYKFIDSNINGFFYVDGTIFTTVQAAITAACAAGGGTVLIPPGTYPQNSPFTLCSNLNLMGAGRCQVDAGNCPTTITTNMVSGDLFPITNLTDMHLADFGVKSTALTAANDIIRLNYGQRVVVERLYLYGGGSGFTNGIELDTSSASTGSTIRNVFRDILITGLAPGGIGCLLNSNDATAKVINSNLFLVVACQGGLGGVGLKVMNTNALQNINENLFYGDEFATGGNGAGGTGILFTPTATRGMVFLDANVESNSTGLSKGIQNTITLIGGNFSSNGTNVTDAQPAFSQFIGTNVGGTVQSYAVTPIGGQYIDGLGIGGAAPMTNTINGGNPWSLAVAGATQATVNNSTPVIRPASGKNLTLLNGQNNLTPVAGTGADANVFAWSVPAGIVPVGSAVRIRFWFSHSTGTAAVNYKLKIGSTTITNFGSPAGTGTFMGGITLYNQGGGQCAKADEPLITSTPSIQAAPNYFAGNACDFSAGFTVSLTFNVANTDQVTPQLWTAELVQ